jgi:hypothetical protein
MMHDLVELSGELGVDRRDGAIDRARQIAVKRDRAGERLLDQCLDEFLCSVGFGLPGCRNDLVKEAGRFRRFGGCRAGFGS